MCHALKRGVFIFIMSALLLHKKHYIRPRNAVYFLLEWALYYCIKSVTPGLEARGMGESTKDYA
jgi:hypothetical protein